MWFCEQQIRFKSELSHPSIILTKLWSRLENLKDIFGINHREVGEMMEEPKNGVVVGPLEHGCYLGLQRWVTSILGNQRSEKHEVIQVT